MPDPSYLSDPAYDRLAAFAATTIPMLAERIPTEPARLLGRLGAPQEADPYARGALSRPAPVDGEPAGLTALRAFGPLPAERLLGALELLVAVVDWSGAPALSGLPRPPARERYAMTMTGGQVSAAISAAALLEQLHPGLTDHTVALVAELSTHPAVACLPAGTAAEADEPAVAAAHGVAHLGLAVAVAGVVVHQSAPWPIVDRAAAVVGLGVGAAAVLLRDAPMPPAYAAALLAKIRAEYLLPRQTSGSVHVAGHRFGLGEHGFGDPTDVTGDRADVTGNEADVTGNGVDVTGNGLVAVADGGIVVRTGVETGSVRVELLVLADAPTDVEPGWEEVVEVSWRAAEGHASVVSPDGTPGPRLSRLTPPWPGDYRVRVHARGRDDLDADYERYQLVVWAAPTAPDTVHVRTDRLGHRLRGEPEPVRPPRPEHAYRWVRRSLLDVAATVTVVTAATVEQTLRAFGADPARPVSIDDLLRYQSLRSPFEAWLTVLDAGDAVLVVELNGYRGSDAAVLSAASAHGRAASMYWNVNAMTRLSFAERGRVLASFEPQGYEETPPEVAAALTGLDFAELGDRSEKGLVAVERFTGRGLTPADLARIQDADVGYRIDR